MKSTLEHVSYRYAGAREPAVDDISLSFEPGTLTVVAGANGSGKSTLLRMVAGLLRPTTGKVSVGENGGTPDNLRRHVGYVPQQSGLDMDLTVWQVLRFHASLQGLKGRRRDERVRERLSTLELNSHANTLVKRLSGGLLQRVSLAVSTVHDPTILLLDEPLNALDPRAVRTMVSLLGMEKRLGRTIVVVTHQLAGAETWADQVAILQQGRLVAHGNPGRLVASMPTQATLRIDSGEIGQDELRKAIPEAQWWMRTSEGEIRIGVPDASIGLGRLLETFPHVRCTVQSASLEDYFLMVQNNSRGHPDDPSRLVPLSVVGGTGSEPQQAVTPP